MNTFVRSFEAPALIAMLGYVVGCFVLYPEFPFARVDMFSAVGPRHDGASPVLLVDGEPTDVHTLVGFRDLEPSDIVVPTGIASSEGYVLDELRNYLTTHRATASSPPGPLRVSFAWRRHHVRADGVILDDGDLIVRTGTASRAP